MSDPAAAACRPEPLPDDSTTKRPDTPTFRNALGYWVKLGFISFGGPAGQIAVMHEELVERRRWISEGRFLHALNYCMVLPGPEAQQLATYLGWLMHRSAGGVAAGSLFVLPALAILIALSCVYMAFGQLPAVVGVFHGIKPAVTALVLHAGYRIGSRTLKNAWLWAIAALSFLAIFAFGAPFPAIVLAAGIVGHVGGRLRPERFTLGGGGAAAARRSGRAVIDDDTPTPPHARFTWRRVAWIAVLFGAAWAAALGALAAAWGWEAVPTQMGWFFTKAALLTFGGAYAVLPYVYQGGVEHYQWLTASQMIDGLALGETTPGPLSMVVAFIGFVGGWSHPFVAGARVASAVVAAVVVTYFTFLPSFFFIFLGGPIIESTHGNLRFTAPLTAITAAVVGVIVNLAAFFALHVFWPRGLQGGVDGFAVVVGLAAALALFGFRIGVIPVVLGAGLAGLGWTALQAVL